MASYKLQIKPSAAKEIEALPSKDRKRIVAKIRKLAVEPRPPGSEKLSGHELFRIRQRDYRIVYAVSDADLILIIIKIGHRRDVYR